MSRAPVFDRPATWLNAGYLARVVSLDDPEGLNRVQVRLIAFDGIDDQDAPMWARVVAPFAGQDRGAFFMPDVDDEVLVRIHQRRPAVPAGVGGLWNGRATRRPTSATEGNRYKRIRSKNGITITLDDQQGQETLTMETPGGQTRDPEGRPGVDHPARTATATASRWRPAGITIQAAAKVKVEPSTVEVSAGMVTVDAAMANSPASSSASR